MDLNRFTEKLQEALRAAQSKAIRYSHQQIDVEHLLVALLEQENGLAAAILAKRRFPGDVLRQKLEQELDRCRRSPGPPARRPTRSTSPAA